jgi:hypothetical protein
MPPAIRIRVKITFEEDAGVRHVLEFCVANLEFVECGQSV